MSSHVNLFSLLLPAAALVLCACEANYKADKTPYPTFGHVERLDPAMDGLIAPGIQMHKLWEGFDWAEGPVWVATKEGGYLLFSDIPPNSIMKWEPGKGGSLFMKPSGYTGETPRGGEPGSNGLMLDPLGRLVMCQHGDRRVARLDNWLDPNGSKTTIADGYDGKRLNSPNDLVFHRNGDLYVTDPPYGLVGNMNDPAKELDFQGVYRVKPDGTITLLTKEMSRPNGIVFSPDYKTLYVANSDPAKAVWMSFPVNDDGTLGEGKVFFDSTPWVGKLKGLPDGMVMDVDGNLWATGPGGVWVFNPQGKPLGRLLTGEATANCSFGDDGRSLYITADMYLLRIRTTTRGMNFGGVDFTAEARAAWSKPQEGTAMIEVGSKAPSFALTNQNDQTVKLSDYKGRWVVLYFYPKDDTPGCTTEACEFTEGIEAFDKLDAVVLGCSADSPESHRKFIEKHGLKVTLLSDPERKVMTEYGAWGKKTLYGKTTEGVIRSTVIIDPKGRVAHHWKQVKAAGHAEKVREVLSELAAK